MINKLQSLKGKTKLIFYKNINNYYTEMKSRNFHFPQQDLFSRNAEGISKIYHEVLKLMKFLQTNPQVQNMNINYYDLYYTVKTRDKNKDIDNNDYINFNDIITPNHYVEIQPRETILK